MKYLEFNNDEKIDGLEWFAARCGFLHNYSGQGPDVIFNPQELTELVMVRVESLIDAFYKALDRFVIDLFANLDK